MKIDVDWTSTKHYDWTKWSQVKFWLWYFRKYKYINGFVIRICGVYFNIRENNATEKLMKILKSE